MLLQDMIWISDNCPKKVVVSFASQGCRQSYNDAQDDIAHKQSQLSQSLHPSTQRASLIDKHLIRIVTPRILHYKACTRVSTSVHSKKAKVDTWTSIQPYG